MLKMVAESPPGQFTQYWEAAVKRRVGAFGVGIDRERLF
jgi:hypothetical protein